MQSWVTDASMIGEFSTATFRKATSS
ncbi:Bgt-51682 [Blumeria graminis f. sp. tritici]|uniref:Bgt-51682 n=1 Tax=Blumeria graminis f. sp. tritici TaxID=62690 RepID=A0A9X9MES1_BLUGR|nr:Bgt-51682 [Blumeria graminis f. sp. tritici]